MIKNRHDEEKYFDILLSGTSATVVIQNDNTKQIYVAWVGDSKFTICSNNTIKAACANIIPHRANV